MGSMRFAVVVSALVVSASLAASADRPSSLEAASAALEAGDLSTALRRGQQVSSRELAEALVGGSQEARAAALFSAAAADQASTLLLPLAHVAGGWERGPAVAAARAARRIASQLTPQDVEKRELLDEVLAKASARWAAIGAATDSWPDVRVAALTVARDIAESRRYLADDEVGPGYDAAALFVDEQPVVRQAAATLLPPRLVASMLVPLVRMLLEDRDDAAALSAAQALCAELSDAPSDVAYARLGAIGPSGLERIRRMVSGKGEVTDLSVDAKRAPAWRSLTLATSLDAARCLFANGTPDDTAALRALGQRNGARELHSIIDSWKR